MATSTPSTSSGSKVSTSAKVGFYTAISLVIANMVGTGVFTSLGFQLFDIKSPFAIICLWLVGGIIALCGALTYGEIGVALPRSGGEYNYLSKLYHPLFGFLSGWVSVTVGFAAPVALAAMALGNYVTKIFPEVNLKEGFIRFEMPELVGSKEEE